MLHLPTAVVCADERLRSSAALYAQSVGAPFERVENSERIAGVVESLESQRSVTLFVLSDRLDEALSQSVSDGNRRRILAGRPPVTYGFMSAFTVADLNWLILKSWVLSLLETRETLQFAQWDFSSPDPVTHVRSLRNGTTHIAANNAPWSDAKTTMMGLRAHGASFDVSMGRAVLCGQSRRPLPRDRTRRSPTCFHDRICFRMSAPADAPTHRVDALDATPLIWCLDSCASIPFAECAFGEGTSYVFGLIAGAAAGVIGPFLDVNTQGRMNRQSEALLATGASLGEVAAWACRLEPGGGFDKFLLIGSPDVRVAPECCVESQRSDGKLIYRLEGASQYCWRLAIPAEAGSRVFITRDDGGDHWDSAEYFEYASGPDRDLVVILAKPEDIHGWLLASSGGRSPEQFRDYADCLKDEIEAASLLSLAATDSAEARTCLELADGLIEVNRCPGRVRSRWDTAVLLAQLQPAVDAFQRSVVKQFLAQVEAHDFNLDRAANLGFVLEQTVRSPERCPTCRAALYITIIRSRTKPSLARRWVQCANCSGVSLSPLNSPLECSPPTAEADAETGGIRLHLKMRNRTRDPVSAMIVGQARQGAPADALGPIVISLEPKSDKVMILPARLDFQRSGVKSYRILIQCEGVLEFHALKHAVYGGCA